MTTGGQPPLPDADHGPRAVHRAAGPGGGGAGAASPWCSTRCGSAAARGRRPARHAGREEVRRVGRGPARLAVPDRGRQGARAPHAAHRADR